MPEPVRTLPRDTRRILVAGVSGVGKSTLCREIARITGIPYTEIDALFHGPNWTQLPDFLEGVTALSRSESWVTEWQYASARPVLGARADVLIWLDLPFRVVLSRVIRRTIRRRLRSEVLWNGNTEPGIWHAITDREGIIRWAIATRNKYREFVPELAKRRPELVVVRVRSRSEAKALLERLGRRD